MASPMFNTAATDTGVGSLHTLAGEPTRTLVDGLVDHNWLMTLALRRAGGAPLFDIEKREQLAMLVIEVVGQFCCTRTAKSNSNF
jgi:hypothetical protein